MTDEEKVRLWELGVGRERATRPVIAGTGTYDTRHTVELTERATEVGVDAVLVVTPYYVRPNRRGIKAHYEAIAAATDLPIVAYNIPARTATDMPNDLLAELGQIENVVAVKQARYEDIAADRRARPARRQRRRSSPRRWTSAGPAASWSPRTSSGARCAASSTSPSSRHEIEDGLRDLYEALSVTTNPTPIKAAAEHGRPRASAGCGCRWWRRPRRRRPSSARHSSATSCSPRCERVRHPPGPAAGRARRDRQEHDGRRVRRPHRRRRHRADVPDARPARDRPGAARLRLPARARRRHRGDRAHPRARGPRRGAAVRAAPAGPHAADLRRPADRRDGALQARRAQAQGGAGRGRAGRPRPSRPARSPWRWSRWPTRSRTRSRWR